MSTTIFSEPAFFGLDANNPPDQLAPGYLTVCDDAVMVGGADGTGADLQTRPGFRAQFTSAIGTNIYIGRGCIFRDSSSPPNQYYIFPAGPTPTSTSGVLYVWLKGATSPTAITLPGGVNLVAGNAQIERFDTYVFITGWTDGKVYRYKPVAGDLANNLEGITGATTPTYSVAASLTNKTLAAMNTAANLIADLQHGTITPDNATFVNGSGSGIVSPNILDPGTDKWVVNGGTVDCHSVPDTNGTNQNFVRLDAVGDSFITKPSVFYTNQAKTTPYNATASENVPRYATSWKVPVQFRATFPSDIVTVTLFAYSTNSGTPTPVATMTGTLYGTNTANTTVLSTLYLSASGQCDDTQPHYLKLQFTCVSGNPSGSYGPYVWSPSILTDETAAIEIIPSASAFNGALIAYPAASDFTILRSNNWHISIDYGSENGLSTSGNGVDLTSRSQLALKFATYITGIPTPRAKLRLRNGTTRALAIASASPQDTPELQVFTASDGSKYLTADISTLTRDKVWFIDIILITDVVQQGSGGQSAYLIGPIIDAGNLSVGYATYTYAVRERTATTNYLSQSAFASPGLNPNLVQATARLIFSVTPPTNTGAVTEIWRAGGTEIDGLYRKVAEITSGGVVSSPYNSAYVTFGVVAPFVTATVFTDTTPDSALQGAITMVDHTAPAFGSSGAWGPATSVAVFAQRLAIGTQTGSANTTAPGIFLSQVNFGGEIGLYWDIANNLAANNVATQGWYRRVSGNENANSGTAIVRLIPYQQTLVLLFKDMLAVIYGTDPTSFDLSRYQGTVQRGAIAANAVTVFDNVIWFLAEDGLRTWDGGSISAASTRIDRALVPQATLTGTPLSATAFGLCSLFTHAKSLYLAAPFTSSDSDTAGLYILSGSSWMRWNKVKASGGFVFASAADQNDLYLTDGAGMLYKVTGGTFGDTATLAGSVALVTLSIASRWYISPSRRIRGERGAYTGFSNDAAPVFTFTVIPDQNTAIQDQHVFTGGVGETSVTPEMLSLSSQVRGRSLQITWAGVPGTATNYVQLRRLELIATEDRLT